MRNIFSLHPPLRHNINRLKGLNVITSDFVFTSGSLIPPNGTTFPVSPVNMEFFIKSDENKAYFYDGDAATPAWVGVGGGVTDHGALTGLTNDDHAQYCHLTKNSQVLQTSDIEDPSLLLKNTAASGLKSGLEVGSDNEELSSTTTGGGGADHLIDTAIAGLADSGLFDGFIVEITNGVCSGERRMIVKTQKASNRLDVVPNFSDTIAIDVTYKVYSRSLVSLTSRGTDPNFSPGNFMRGLHLTGIRNQAALVIWDWYGKGIEIRASYATVTTINSGAIWTNAAALLLSGSARILNTDSNSDLELNPQGNGKINFKQKPTTGFVAANGDVFPESPVHGQEFYRNDLHKKYVYDATLATPAWQEI